MQGDRLARTIRVAGLDQRGVERSAPLPPGSPAVTIEDLVSDCDRVRRALGIERWAVLGQSFGGNLALRYAAAYPDTITAAIFENPAWDMVLTCRAALPRIAGMLAEPGRDKQAEAQAALDAASRDVGSWENPARALRAAYLAALAALGPDSEQFFVPRAATRERQHQIEQSQPAVAEATTMRHNQEISGSDAFFESVLPLLEKLRCPALLITGELDPITSVEQREAFRDASPANKSARFPGAGHFVHADEPDAYAEAVTGFLHGA